MRTLLTITVLLCCSYVHAARYKVDTQIDYVYPPTATNPIPNFENCFVPDDTMSIEVYVPDPNQHGNGPFGVGEFQGHDFVEYLYRFSEGTGVWTMNFWNNPDGSRSDIFHMTYDVHANETEPGLKYQSGVLRQHMENGGNCVALASSVWTEMVAGDANRDSRFDSDDIVQIFQKGKYNVDQFADWDAGDFNGDHRFNSSDLVLALQTGDYNAVPEPRVSLLVMFALIGVYYAVLNKRDSA